MIAFGIRSEGESYDLADLALPWGQDELTNTGERAGADVPQLYLTEAPGETRMRLLGFARVELQPGESREVTLTADPRLLARFDGDAGQWHIAEGTYTIALGKAADLMSSTAEVAVERRRFGT